MHRSVFAGALVIGAIAAFAACSERAPLAPSAGRTDATPTGSQGATTRTVSGRVWHHSASGVVPASGGVLFGWVEQQGGGHTTGAVSISPEGLFQFDVTKGTTYVSVYAGGFEGQPCAVTFEPTADVTTDVHVIVDSSLRGPKIPAALMAQFPTLSGVVYQQTPAGRQPLAGAWVTLDGLDGMGLLTADTYTDAEGRYALCGLPKRNRSMLVLGNAGFEITYVGFEEFAGKATLDIEMRRTIPLMLR